MARQGFTWKTGLAALLLGAAVVTAASAATYRFERKWGTYGVAGNYKLQNPWCLAISPTSGNLLVTDTSNNRVVTYTQNGAYVGQFQFWSAPRGIAVSALGEVFVGDANVAVVVRRTLAGSWLGDFGSYGADTEQFGNPAWIALTALGDIVYVADWWNNRVAKWQADGTHLLNFGSDGTGDGQFGGASAVAVNPVTGQVYVADFGNHRIQKFDANGNFLAKWGSQGTQPGQFSSPSGIALDGVGSVFVMDSANGRVQKFTPAGQFITQFGRPGSADGELSYAYGIAVAGKRVFVADTSNHRIQVFRENRPPSAPTTVTISPASPHDNHTLTATAVATDPDGDALTYRYAWYKSADGLTWSPGPTARTVAFTLTTVGQQWRVKARAHDGDLAGNWKTSAPVTIATVSSPALLAAAATPNASGGAQLSLTLTAAASVAVTIRNLAGREVAQLAPRDLGPGVSTLLWDGKSRTGTKAPAGQYLVTVRARTADGREARAVTPLRR